MVKKFFKLFSSEITGLHEAAFLLGIFALVSQFLGLFRDRILASSFGAGLQLDLYYSSFRIPDFIFVTVASIVSVFVLIPFISERMDKGELEVRKFIGSIFTFFSILMVGISIIAFFLIPVLTPIIFKGMKDSPNLPDLINMTRILLLSPIFLGLSNFFANITQVSRKFLIYALCPIFYNVGIILGIVVFYPIFGLYGLSFGVILGSVLHFAIQIPSVIKSGLLSFKEIKMNFSEIYDVVKISIPRTLALSMSQISIMVLLGFASLMKEGSIAIFNFAYNLEAVPMSIIGVSYATVAFPTLSNLFVKGKKTEFMESLASGAKHIIFWSIPISVLFIVLRAQIVRVIYGAGEFDWTSTRLTAAMLAIFIVSAVAQSLSLLLIRGFYASGETKKVVISNIVSMLSTIFFTFIFLKFFESNQMFKDFVESILRVDGIAGTEVLMLALGFTLSSLLNCIVLWFIFNKENKGFSNSLLNTLFQSFCASIIMGAVTYFSLNIFDNIFSLDTFWGVFLQGMLSGLVGIIVCVIILWLLKSNELSDVFKTLHKRFWTVKTVAPDTIEI
jgi:putative peptidoglycan lipid II flippase